MMSPCGMRLIPSGCGDISYMARHGDVADMLHRRAYDAEHTAMALGLAGSVVCEIVGYEVVLLYGAESLGRGGVASEDDELASEIEEFQHGLPCEFVDDIKRARAVWGTRVVAEIEVVVLWQTLLEFLQDGKSSVT